jgi:hypothetical protein
MSLSIAEESIALPKKSLKNLMRAMDDFRDAQDEIEDFLLFSNETILKETRSAREDHQNGRTLQWDELKKSYGL